MSRPARQTRICKFLHPFSGDSPFSLKPIEYVSFFTLSRVGVCLHVYIDFNLKVSFFKEINLKKKNDFCKWGGVFCFDE